MADPGLARRAARSVAGEQLLMPFPAQAVATAVGAEQWQVWLTDPETQGRYEALVYRRGPDQCAYWLGAISSTGHGKFRAGSRARARPEAGPSRIVTAHVYAYQLHHGVIPAARAGQAAIRHQCDETSCQNRDHLVIGTQLDNVWDYRARRGREGGPLADWRGARGRAVAIRAAILAARRAGTSTGEALQQAISAGVPSRPDRLF